MARIASLAVLIAGAVAVIVGPVLDWYEISVTAGPPEATGLAQQISGWDQSPGLAAALVTLAVISLGAAGATYFRGTRQPAAMATVAGIVAVGLVVSAIVSPPAIETGTVSPSGAGQFFDATRGPTATLVGLWLALGGAIGIVLGSIGVVFAESIPAPGRKRCPDCYARVPTQARVCRHCGYRFA